jgi:hypothetical protein
MAAGSKDCSKTRATESGGRRRILSVNAESLRRLEFFETLLESSFFTDVPMDENRRPNAPIFVGGRSDRLSHGELRPRQGINAL